ncbi:hypothetical protein KAZ82_01825 [Candidatus Babeliales bacterium]|nr:hypothetical protein [Candidatus Babeliales bacterium]
MKKYFVVTLGCVVCHIMQINTSSNSIAKLRSIRSLKKINSSTQSQELSDLNPINTPPLSRTSSIFSNHNFNSFLQPNKSFLEEQELRKIESQLKLLQEPDARKKQLWLPDKTLSQKLKNQQRNKNRQKLLPHQREDIDKQMFVALQKDDPLKLQDALDLGADPNAQDAWGFTPLHLAKSGATTQILLDADANPHTPGPEGFLPIQTHNNSKEKVKALLLAGSNTKDLNDDFIDNQLRQLRIETKKNWLKQKELTEQLQKEHRDELNHSWTTSIER